MSLVRDIYHWRTFNRGWSNRLSDLREMVRG